MGIEGGQWFPDGGYLLAEPGCIAEGEVKWQAFSCGQGIWLAAASKAHIWNALCISLERIQTVLWKLQLVASHK